jgi:hypothetical protein
LTRRTRGTRRSELTKWTRNFGKSRRRRRFAAKGLVAARAAVSAEMDKCEILRSTGSGGADETAGGRGERGEIGRRNPQTGPAKRVDRCMYSAMCL